jgi:hypothetical protein
LFVIAVNDLVVYDTQETMAKLTELQKALEFWEEIHNDALLAQESWQIIEMAENQRVTALDSLCDAATAAA